MSKISKDEHTTSKSGVTAVAGGSSDSSSSESNDNSNADSDRESEEEEESRNSSTSSSDEFYDAEEPTGTLLRCTWKILDNPKDRVDLTTLTRDEVDSGSSELFPLATPTDTRHPNIPSASSSSSFVMNSSSLSATSILSRSEMEEELEEEKRRKRLEEMRRRLNTDEIEETQGDEGTSPSDSQTSSVEGLYGATSGKTSHPFKVVDHDTISMQSGVSVGRMGRISSNNTVPFPSAMNSNNYTFQQQQPAYGQGHAQSQPSTSTAVNLSPSTSGKPHQHQPQSSIFQSSLGSNNHNNNHYHNQQLHNHFLHSSSTTASSSSSVSSSEQVPSVSSTATTIPALYSATEGNSPVSETSSNCSSSIFSVQANTTLSNTRSPTTAPEPDLVASCTAHGLTSAASNNHGRSEFSVSGMSAPVAPPRRKRKGLIGKTLSEDGGGGSLQDFPITYSKEFTTQPQAQSLPRRPTSAKFDSRGTTSSLPSPNPPSPTVSIRSVCRELDKTLSENTSQNKIFVVKAQDEEKTRAKSSGPKVLKRTESLPKDTIAAFDPSGTGSGGFRDSSSGSSTLTSSTVTNTTTSMNPSGEDDSIVSASPKPAIQERTSVTAHGLEPSFPFVRGGTGTGRSNSAPKSGSNQLAALISAMAIEGEKRDIELEKEKAQISLMIRTRTDSGKLLSDLEILEQVQVLNLDTGERVPLSNAEDKIPQCINPLSLHIMRLTSEYVGGNSGLKDRDSDEESLDSKKSSAASQEDGESSSVRRKTAQVKRFLGSTVRKTVDKAKSLAQRKHPKEDVEISTNEGVQLGSGMDSLVKMKASHSHKGPYDFDQLQQVQDLFGEHCGPVWCMKFSNCGRLLATAGQDKIIRIWVLKDHLPYFQDMRTKNTSDKVSPTPSQESIVSQHSHHSAEEMLQACEMSDPRSPFVPRPLCVYSGHTADLLDIAWSKSFFLLSSSMDRTVRLWHISRRECLCCFQHIDFVTAIAFHPRDDRYFLSGSLDGKLRLWNIPDKKVALWNEVNGPNNLITAANFCQNGKFAVVGTYDGRCIFYHTEQLKYHTQIIVHRRKRLAGRKITGIEPMPGEDKILVTSNDSRIRMYDLRDLSLTCKYKGFTNSSSQIKGTFSHDGKYVVSGSENQCVYIWKTNHDYSKFSSARKDRNGYWEGVKAHNAVVTCAVFAPDPDLIVKQIDKKDDKHDDDKNQRVGMVKSPSLTKSNNQPYHQQTQSHSSSCPAGYVLVSADFSGCIKVFFSRVKPKHSSLPASALV